MAFGRVLVWTAFAALAVAVPCTRAAPPEDFKLRTIVRGLETPTAFAYAPDGRVFITEKRGVVRVLSKRKLRTFLDLRDEVNEFSDRGLNNLIIDAKGRLYLFFTEELRPDDPDELHPAAGRLIRIEPSKDNRNRADPKTRRTLISGFESTGPWHSVGGLDFDSRGNLIVGFGDGSPYYPKEISEAAIRQVYDPSSLSGKILRIDPDNGHGVVANPLFDPGRANDVASKVIARGFRMPYRLTADADAIFVGDVGTDQYEEINIIELPSDTTKADVNYGWPCYEGGDKDKPVRRYVEQSICISRFYSIEDGDDLTAAPAYAYRAKGGAAIVLGPIYRGSTYPSEYEDTLFFSDYVRDRFWTFDDGDASDFGTPGEWGRPTDVGVTPAGNLAYTASATGLVIEIIHPGGDEEDHTSSNATAWIAGGVGGLTILALGILLWRRRVKLIDG